MCVTACACAATEQRRGANVREGALYERLAGVQVLKARRVRAVCAVCLNTETKNQWARDDPAFIAILVVFMAVAAIAYSVAFNAWNPVTLLRIMFWAAFIEFLGLGLATATLGWFATHNTAHTPHTYTTHRTAHGD